jgi:dienelactone hydrolase
MSRWIQPAPARRSPSAWRRAVEAWHLLLLPLLKGWADVDPRNLFMVGLSRGGLMTYLAIRHKVAINAAAVIAGGGLSSPLGPGELPRQ